MTLAATDIARPAALPGFGHVKRYLDRKQKAWVARILPGEYYVSRSGELIATVLGSCVAACVRDRTAGVAGMNHFMLPGNDASPSPATGSSAAARYGSYAMEQLINELLRHGARRERLEASIFGGARMFRTGSGRIDVGTQNIRFVREYLATERIRVIARDLGGERGRSTVFDTTTGKIQVRLLGTEGSDIASREQDYSSRLSARPTGGDVELF